SIKRFVCIKTVSIVGLNYYTDAAANSSNVISRAHYHLWKNGTGREDLSLTMEGRMSKGKDMDSHELNLNKIMNTHFTYKVTAMLLESRSLR
ncbi:unnamed protein product, partial [Dovyalis caffra]